MKKKEVDTVLVSLSQNHHEINLRNNKAKKYSNSVAAKQKKHRKRVDVALALFCGLAYGGIVLDAFDVPSLVFANKTETEETEKVSDFVGYEGLIDIPTECQQYIVRYGHVSDYADNGNTIITTDDGNTWEVTDAPEMEEIRILFDSQGTLRAEDDVIIDITSK